MTAPKPGEVWLLRGELCRVHELDGSRVRYQLPNGWGSSPVDMFDEMSCRLKGHPWGTDSDWREGDEYRMPPYASLGVAKVRNGQVVATTPWPWGAFIARSNWGDGLSFVPTWTAVESEVGPAAGGVITSAQLIHEVEARRPESVRKGSWSDATIAVVTRADEDCPASGARWHMADVVPMVVLLREQFGVRLDKPIVTMADAAEAGLLPTGEHMVLEMPRLPGESMIESVARLDSLQDRVAAATEIRMADTVTYGFNHFTPNFGAYVDAEPKQLTRAELIEAVQAMCPKDKCKAAWDYAAERHISQSLACDSGTTILAAQDLAHIFGRYMDSPPLSVEHDYRDAFRDLFAHGQRLHVDGLRQAALDAMPCPDGHDPGRWRRKCIGYIEDHESNYIPFGDGPPDVDALDSLVRQEVPMFPNTVDAGPRNPWWDSAAPRLDTRGPHGDDADGGGL